MRLIARPVWSGPTLNRKVAPTWWRRNRSSRAGTPSRVPRSVSTAIFSARMLIAVANAVQCRPAAAAADRRPSSIHQLPRFGDLPAVGVEYALQRVLHRHRRLPPELGAG